MPLNEMTNSATSTEASRSSRTKKIDHARILAGWLIIVSGLLALINGLTALAHETSVLWLDIDIALNQFSVCASIVIIFGIAAIAGGVAAIRGKRFFLALVGAALGTLGDGIAGVVLGLTAITLLFFSNEDV